jgi:hypothetical protein
VATSKEILLDLLIERPCHLLYTPFECSFGRFAPGEDILKISTSAFFTL